MSFLISFGEPLNVATERMYRISNSFNSHVSMDGKLSLFGKAFYSYGSGNPSPIFINNSDLLDNTVLPDIFLERGVSAFADVDGTVNFINYANGVITVVGDYLGRKPIYYYYKKNLFTHTLIVAPALKCFFGLPIQEVSLLGMGEYLTFDGSLSKGTYTSVSRTPVSDEISDSDAIKLTHDLLSDATEKIINSHRSPCVLLSGGVDSTVVCALAKRFEPDIVAYTFSVGDKGKQDLHYARVAAKGLGVELREVVVSADDVMDFLPEIVCLNEDFNWTQITSAVGQYFLARAIKCDLFETALCGDLADEVFASYPQIERWSWRDDQYLVARDRLINKAYINPVRAVKVLGGAGGLTYADPFSDRSFLEFASNVPARFKDGELGGRRVNKWLLRSAFADEIPTEIATRPKGCQGAVSYVDELFNSPDGKELIKNIYKSKFNHDGRIV